MYPHQVGEYYGFSMAAVDLQGQGYIVYNQLLETVILFISYNSYNSKFTCVAIVILLPQNR